MDIEARERELIGRTRRFVKTELKRADLTYEELVDCSASMAYRRRRVRLQLRSVEERFPRPSLSP